LLFFRKLVKQFLTKPAGPRAGVAPAAGSAGGPLDRPEMAGVEFAA
jgi:hypothetical protein